MVGLFRRFMRFFDVFNAIMLEMLERAGKRNYSYYRVNGFNLKGSERYMV